MSTPARPPDGSALSLGENVAPRREGSPVSPAQPAAARDDRLDALPLTTRFECGVCWWVYAPDDGEPVWQIPPGTPFLALPAHWTCPQCEGAAEQFMVIGGEAA